MGLAVRDGGEAVPGATPDETGGELTGLPEGAMAAAVEEVNSGKVKLVPGAMGVAKVVVVVLSVGTAAAAVLLLLLGVSGAAALRDVNDKQSKKG